MNNGNIKVAVKNLIKSEDNKEYVLALMNGREMEVITVAKEWGKCKFTAQKTLKSLVEAKVMTVRFIKKSGSRTSLFKPNGEKYIRKTENELLANFVSGNSAKPYGTGEFFNPWTPSIPKGVNERTVRLFNEKDNDYFKMPLKKSRKNTIGSTFSLYDGAIL